MKKTIKNIYLTWRTGKGDRRIPIGRIKKNSSEGIIFSYFKNNVEEAKKLGFVPFEGFPDIDKIYTSNVLEIKKIGDRIEARLIYSAKNQDNKNDFFRKEFILPQNISQLIYENVNKDTFLKVPKDNLDLNLIGLDGRVYYYESKNWNQYSIKNYLTAMSYKDEGKSYIDFNNFLNSKINYENYYKQFENEIPYINYTYYGVPYTVTKARFLKTNKEIRKYKRQKKLKYD